MPQVSHQTIRLAKAQITTPKATIITPIISSTEATPGPSEAAIFR